MLLDEIGSISQQVVRDSHSRLDLSVGFDNPCEQGFTKGIIDICLHCMNYRMFCLVSDIMSC